MVTLDAGMGRACEGVRETRLSPASGSHSSELVHLQLEPGTSPDSGLVDTKSRLPSL